MKVFGIFGNTGYIGIRNDARYEEYVEYWGYSEYVWILMISGIFRFGCATSWLECAIFQLGCTF